VSSVIEVPKAKRGLFRGLTWPAFLDARDFIQLVEKSSAGGDCAAGRLGQELQQFRRNILGLLMAIDYGLKVGKF
jgi:hypothetical protein